MLSLIVRVITGQHPTTLSTALILHRDWKRYELSQLSGQGSGLSFTEQKHPLREFKSYFQKLAPKQFYGWEWIFFFFFFSEMAVKHEKKIMYSKATAKNSSFFKNGIDELICKAYRGTDIENKRTNTKGAEGVGWIERLGLTLPCIN